LRDYGEEKAWRAVARRWGGGGLGDMLRYEADHLPEPAMNAALP
jgi:hypothetical protein